jgi:hypothetical protein
MTVVTHGMSKTRTYLIWKAMLTRCRTKRYAKYYGDKPVCDRWHSFEAFLEDMGEAPPGLTLDREDNRLGYSPANCRWASWAAQAQNTRASKIWFIKGLNFGSSRAAAKFFGVHHTTIQLWAKTKSDCDAAPRYEASP